MSKPRIYGMKSGYIPNAKADVWNKPHIYQRGWEIAERDPHEIHERREMKRLEQEKCGPCTVDPNKAEFLEQMEKLKEMGG